MNKPLDNTYYPCYVCKDIVKMKMDKYCSKFIDGELRFRHLWHGVPGITRTAPSAGIQGYAKTLEDAKRRAEYYINSNPYAAPEVKAGEEEILEELNRLEKLYEEKGNV